MRNPNHPSSIPPSAGEANRAEQVGVSLGDWESVRRGVGLMLTSLKAMALITLVPAWFLLVAALAPHSGNGGDPGFDINVLVIFVYAAGVALLCLGIALVSYLLGVARSLAAPADCRLRRLTWVCRTGCAGGVLFILPALVLACVRGALRIWHIRLAIGLLTLTGSLLVAAGCAGYCLYLALICAGWEIFGLNGRSGVLPPRGAYCSQLPRWPWKLASSNRSYVQRRSSRPPRFSWFQVLAFGGQGCSGCC